MPLYVMLIIVLALTGILLVGLIFAVRLPATANYRINVDRERKLQGMKLYKHAVINMTFSLGCVFALTYGPYDYLFHAQETPLWRMVVNGVGIVLLYDFLYYLMHRFLFHAWKPLRRVHALHHTAQYPTAIDALYVHPIETFMGLGLLILSTFIIGPIHINTFAVLFLIYSFLNVLIHSGLDLRFFPFRSLTYLAKKHDTHHVSMRAGNFGSITPLWDLLFGTLE